MFVQLLNIFPVLLPLKPRRWFICFYNICTIWIILNPVNGARVHRDGPPVFSLTLLVIPELLIEFMTFLFFFHFHPDSSLVIKTLGGHWFTLLIFLSFLEPKAQAFF